MNLIVVPDYVE